jgi:hypothetical protein
MLLCCKTHLKNVKLLNAKVARIYYKNGKHIPNDLLSVVIEVVHIICVSTGATDHI